MKVYLSTKKGTGRPASDDRVLVGHGTYEDAEAEVSIDCGAVAIADGVGGNNAGGAAADIVCKGIADTDEISEAVFAGINQMVLSDGRSNACHRDMATTLSGVFFSSSGNQVLFHIGNTRIYSIQALRYLAQITRDDTVVDYLFRSGKITEAEAEAYPSRNEITACFGGGKESLFQITLEDLDASKYTHFLMTSDGIHESLSLDDMEDILDEADGNWLLAVKSLVEGAKAQGSLDDCTAVIVSISKKEEE